MLENSNIYEGQIAPRRATLADSIASSDADSTMSTSTDGSNPNSPETDSAVKPHSKDKEPQRTVTGHISAFWHSLSPRASAPPSQPVDRPKSEVCILQGILRSKENDLNALEEAKEQIRLQLDSCRGKLDRAGRHIARLKERHAEEVEALQDKIAKYRINNETSVKIIETLEAKAAENEARLGKAYSGAMSTWAQDVSRDMPDDVIRSTISSFFQGDFFSWCADMSATDINWCKDYEQIIEYNNLVNQSHRYRSGPAHLLFDCAAPGGYSSLILLQAALAKSLISSFLKNPYFLTDDGTILQKFESTLAERSLREATNWRANTVRSLERTFPLDPVQIEAHAHRFLSKFGFLLQQQDKSALDDLEDLFTRFSQIALKLWQTPTQVRVLNMETMTDWPFELKNPYADCEPAAVSALGEKLNGRPVGVVIRPCILSDPIAEPGEQLPPVVWSKALVWVSSEKDPYEIED